jgi:4-hydroxybenzoate polyprenyltransferase
MHFIKLIRPINLFIIVLTMCGVVTYVQSTSIFEGFQYNKLHFWLLTLSTVMIAAAGNIINDYFDVRADRINKPEKLIITKHIKRRWAIVSHWGLNGVAFAIGVYLSAVYNTFSFAFIHLVSINLLWFYSMYFKRKVLIGNLVIAFLTSLVPILALTFMYFSPGDHNVGNQDLTTFQGILDIDFSMVHLVAFFAFFQNLAREIIKDIQDIEGDKLIYVKSLPMVIGIKGSKLISSAVLFLLPAFLLLNFLNLQHEDLSLIYSKYSFFILAAFVNISVIILSYTNVGLKTLDMLIKISMLFGILALFQIGIF